MCDDIFNATDQLTLERILHARRDVRGNHFLPKPVEPDKIQKILKAASLAPSVGYSQPWKFVFVENHETRKNVIINFQQMNKEASKKFTEKQSLYSKLKLEGIREAPVNIAVFYQSSKQAVLGQNSMTETGKYSVVCAIQNMWLMARVLNIGMGWVSILDAKKIQDLLHAPANCEFIAYLCLGYVDEFLPEPELKLKGWEQAQSIENAVFFDQFRREKPVG